MHSNISSVLAIAALLLSSLSAHHHYHVPRRYTNFQAIGFGIYTGSAPAVLGINETCIQQTQGRTTSLTLCPSGVTIDDPFTGTTLCLDCLVFNPECKCDIDDMTCHRHTGVLDNFEASCYLGNENVTQDVMGRVQIMEDAVERAYEVSDKTTKTLKIFNAPEFFWRGPRGAYPASTFFESDGQFNALYQIGHALDRIVQQKRFQDWLFVFGTAVAGADEVNLSTRDTRSVYLNFAPVFRGFDPETTSDLGMRMLVPKRYISTIDFLADGGLSSERLIPNPFDDDKDGFANLYDNVMWNALRNRLSVGENGTLVDGSRSFALIENGWFVLDGITFTLEICVDFAVGFAKQSFSLLSASRGRVPIPRVGQGTIEEVAIPNYMAQLSIVTGAGMDVKSGENLALTSGGSIFLQDGLNPHQPHLKTCTVSKLDDGSLGYKDCERSPNGSSPPNVPYQSFDLYSSIEVATMALKGLYSLAKGIQPQIHVFETRPIVDVVASVIGSCDSMATTAECSVA